MNNIGGCNDLYKSMTLLSLVSLNNMIRSNIAMAKKLKSKALKISTGHGTDTGKVLEVYMINAYIIMSLFAYLTQKCTRDFYFHVKGGQSLNVISADADPSWKQHIPEQAKTDQHYHVVQCAEVYLVISLPQKIYYVMLL